MSGEVGEQSDRQFGLRVFFVLAVAVALPFGVGYLLESPGAMAFVLFGELVAGCFYRPTRIVALPLFVILMLLLLLPLLRPNGPVLRSHLCSNNLKQIAIALHNYHDVYDCFPPAYVADEQDRPAHSWRVLVLPYLTEETCYEQYQFDEPWNGPSNHQLAREVPYVYRCPSEANELADTSYVFIVGDGSPWAEGRAPHIDEITRARGTTNTIMVIEVPDSKINWTEPRDLTLDQLLQRIATTSTHHSASNAIPALNVAYADGSVRLVPVNELEELLTRRHDEE